MAVRQGFKAEWLKIRQYPIETRRAILARCYDELCEEDKFVVDCLSRDLLDRLRERGAGKRFSMPMARELLNTIILLIAVAEENDITLWKEKEGK